MIDLSQRDRYADIVASYLSRLSETEVFEAIRDVTRTDLNTIFQSAIKLEFYEVCQWLQIAALKFQSISTAI